MISGAFVKTIDTATNTLDSGGVGDETFPSGSAGIALTPDQSQIWVAHSDPNFFVNRIQTDGSDGAQPPLTNLGSGSGPKAIAFTPDGSRAYVASVNGAGVFPIDTATGVASAAIPLPDSARSIAITPDGSRAFVPSAPATTRTSTRSTWRRTRSSRPRSHSLRGPPT